VSYLCSAMIRVLNEGMTAALLATYHATGLDIVEVIAALTVCAFLLLLMIVVPKRS